MDNQSARLAIFRTPVSSCIKEEALTVLPDTACSVAILMMRVNKKSCVVVQDANDVVQGIVTEQDVVRRVVFQEDADCSIDKIMSDQVQAIESDALLYQAVSIMRRHNLKHLPVVSKKGEVIGVVQLSDVLVQVSSSVMQEVDSLYRSRTIKEIARSKKAQIHLAQNLLEEQIPAPEIQSVISGINNDFNRQILDKVIEEMHAVWGPPPVHFALIIMGSGGRKESFLQPDQDNGFILEDYPDEAHNRIDAWFIECASRFNLYLDDIGFPLCEGYIMARNPMWRKTITQWKQQIGIWVAKGEGNALRFADIFFDFDHAWGDYALVEALRTHISDTVRNRKRFLREMFRYDDAEVALGMFSRLKTERSGEHQGRINLKHSGIMPLVHYIRIMALQNGVVETQTLNRIKILRKLGKFNDDTADYLIFAFQFVSSLLLKQQLADSRAGVQVSNFVEPDLLTKREHGTLVEALGEINNLKRQLRAELLGEYL